MQASHAYRRHHGWDSGLMQMILINNGDVENLSFAREPVALNADDGILNNLFTMFVVILCDFIF